MDVPTDQPDTTPPLTAHGLSASGRDFASRALDAYFSGDNAMIRTLAGIMIEHLCKAVLARQNPAFLVDLKGNNFLALMRLTGNPKAVNTSIRTVGAAIALSRAKLFVPLKNTDALMEVIDARNGVLHAGVSDVSNSRRDLVAAFEGAIALVHGLGLEPSEFFGDRWVDMEALRTERRTEVEHEVQRKILHAKRIYDEFADGMPEGALERTIEARTSSFEQAGETMDGQFATVVNCPACGCRCQSKGPVDVDAEVDFDVEDGIAVPYGYWVAEWRPEELNCQVCKLKLRGHAELAAAGHGESVQLSEEEWPLADFSPEPESDPWD